MDEEARVKIICMWCGDLITDIAKKDVKLGDTFHCNTCNQDVKLKSVVHNTGLDLVNLN